MTLLRRRNSHAREQAVASRVEDGLLYAEDNEMMASRGPLALNASRLSLQLTETWLKGGFDIQSDCDALDASKVWFAVAMAD